MDGMDLFNHLVAKQVGKELQKADQEVTDADTLIAKLFKELSKKREDFGDEDLCKFRDEIPALNSELVIFGGLLKGIALPRLGNDEVNTESLGELGACLMVGAQLRSPTLLMGYSAADLSVVLPPEGHEKWASLNHSPRLGMVGSAMFSKAMHWTGAHGEKTSDGFTVEFDGVWAGEPAKTFMDHYVRYAFSGVRLITDLNMLERMEFVRSMRSAME